MYYYAKDLWLTGFPVAIEQKCDCTLHPMRGTELPVATPASLRCFGGIRSFTQIW